MRKLNITASERQVTITTDLTTTKAGEEIAVQFHSIDSAPSGTVKCTVIKPRKGIIKNPLGILLEIFTRDDKTFVRRNYA